MATDLRENPIGYKHPVKRQQSGRGVIRIAPGTADILDDPESVGDWDDEELRRGRRKDKNGRFSGRDPIVVPTAAYREIVRRAIRRAEVEMSVNLAAATETLTEIANNVGAEPRDRIAASKIIIDRIMGREPSKIEISAKVPLFLGIIQAGIVSNGEPVALGTGDSDIIDAEVVSDTDDDDIIFEE